MHPRNLHKNGYQFDTLLDNYPSLAEHVRLNPNGQKTIDFANANSVKALNAALLKTYYHIDIWDIPSGYLCPPVPGRADYIHAMADLLKTSTNTTVQTPVKGLDIGTGANLIYPIIGSQAYGWKFVASDIDKGAVAAASLIQSANKVLKSKVEVRHQSQTNQVFAGIVKPSEYFDFSMCNPPFHASEKAAKGSAKRKVDNLKHHQIKRGGERKFSSKDSQSSLNFSGQQHELWCEGGELGFIQKMLVQSLDYASQIGWFTSLVSNKDNLPAIQKFAKANKVAEYKVVNMQQGNKSSRFVAWRF